MVLVDTSVWIDHLRRHDRTLAHLLDHQAVLQHPFVIGELACGNLHHRQEVLEHLQRLPASTVASDAEARHLVEAHALHGQGLGWVDVHLLAAARLTGCRLWARDRALARAAEKLGVI